MIFVKFLMPESRHGPESAKPKDALVMIFGMRHAITVIALGKSSVVSVATVFTITVV